MNSYQKIYTLLIENDSLEEATAKQKLLATALGLGGLAGAVANVGKDRPHPPVTGPSIRTTSQRTPVAQLPKLQAKRDAPVAPTREIAPETPQKTPPVTQKKPIERRNQYGETDAEEAARHKKRRDYITKHFRDRVDALGPNAFGFNTVKGTRYHLGPSLQPNIKLGNQKVWTAKEIADLTGEDGWETKHPKGAPWKDWGY